MCELFIPALEPLALTYFFSHTGQCLNLNILMHLLESSLWDSSSFGVLELITSNEKNVAVLSEVKHIFENLLQL